MLYAVALNGTTRSLYPLLFSPLLYFSDKHFHDKCVFHSKIYDSYVPYMYSQYNMQKHFAIVK